MKNTASATIETLLGPGILITGCLAACVLLGGCAAVGLGPNGDSLSKAVENDPFPTAASVGLKSPDASK